MNKKKIFCVILLILLALGACISFYEATSYYKWTDEALNAKLVRIDNSFSLKNSAANVTASGKLMNCTNSILEVEEGQIIIYCQDISTKEILSFKNTKSYTFNSKQETTVFITIYDGVYSKENLDYASNLIEKYIILKIEYQVSENEIYTINTIAQTGSYLVPLGTIITAPIFFIIVLIALIFVLPLKNKLNEQAVSNTEKLNLNIKDLKLFLKNLSLVKKILLLVLTSLMFVVPIIAGIIALKDCHWSVTTFVVVTAIMGVGILVNLIFTNVIAIKRIITYRTKHLIKKIEPALNYLLETKQKEIETAQNNINEAETVAKRLENQIANEQFTAIETRQATIKQYEQHILANRRDIELKGKSIPSLQRQIEEAKKENLELELKKLHSLDGWQFEKYCATLFRKLGYSVQLTKGSGDFGADLILNNSISVQCKLYSNPVGLHALQEVYSSMARYKTNRACVITNSTFTKQAIEYAHDANIELIDYTVLKSLIKKVSESNSVIELQNAKKINELRAEIANLHNNITDIKFKISEEQKEISKLNAQINTLPEIQDVRQKLRTTKQQEEHKIDLLIEEKTIIKSEISLLGLMELSTTKRIGKKYNLL